MKKILLGEKINKTIFPSNEKFEKTDYKICFCAKLDIKLGDDIDKKTPSTNQKQ